MAERKIIIGAKQNSVTIDGTETKFVEVRPKKKGNCNKCWWLHLASAEECNKIPCNPDEREDRKYGVFTIQQMPNI